MIQCYGFARLNRHELNPKAKCKKGPSQYSVTPCFRPSLNTERAHVLFRNSRCLQLLRMAYSADSHLYGGAGGGCRTARQPAEFGLILAED